MCLGCLGTAQFRPTNTSAVHFGGRNVEGWAFRWSRDHGGLTLGAASVAAVLALPGGLVWVRAPLKSGDRRLLVYSESARTLRGAVR